MTYILLSEKKWHLPLLESLKDEQKDEWILIDNKADFNLDRLNEIQPAKVFIPHWSHMIPAEIYDRFECVVFHMTDLPFGRGGSPLQNLIAQGHTTTKISALRVVKELDAGDIYLKHDLSLDGTAQEIFLRSTTVILKMIREIISKDLQPIPQEGEIVHFKRRKPEDGNLAELKDLDKVYDYIRMLDADGYPNAFIEIGDLKIEFSKATLKNNQTILADVRITKK